MLFIFRGLSISVSMAVNVLCFVCLWSRSLDRLQVFWKRNGVRLTAGVDSFGRRLVISKPTSVDVGLYVCEAAFRNSSQKSTDAKAYLSVLGKTIGVTIHAGSDRFLSIDLLKCPKEKEFDRFEFIVELNTAVSSFLSCITPDLFKSKSVHFHGHSFNASGSSQVQLQAYV